MTQGSILPNKSSIQICLLNFGARGVKALTYGRGALGAGLMIGLLKGMSRDFLF